MFGEKIDDHITMLQRVVALLRDLILGVVILITAMIVSYGGDPATLDALDWIVFVTSASFIVVGPVVVFFLIKFILRLMIRIDRIVMGTLGVGSAVPKGLIAWLFIRVFDRPKRLYVQAWRRRHQRLQVLSEEHPLRYKLMFVYPGKLTRLILSVSSAVYPYLYALLALIAGTVVFRYILRAYIP
jgi:hypothetical protein